MTLVFVSYQWQLKHSRLSVPLGGSPAVMQEQERRQDRSRSRVLVGRSKVLVRNRVLSSSRVQDRGKE